MSDNQSTQITTGEGEENYNIFRRYFHENIDIYHKLSSHHY